MASKKIHSLLNENVSWRVVEEKKPLQKISFIVPHKDDPLIGRLLDSLAKQTKKDFELIIVDSSDGGSCLEGIKKWSKLLRPKIVFAKGGRGTARNIGAQVAKEEILVFVDADVFLPENFVERLTTIFGKTPGLVAVGFPIYPTKLNKVSYLVYRTLRLLDESSYYYGKPRIPTTCSAYHRSIFKFRFFTDLVGEDVLFSADIMKYGRAIFAKQIKVYEEPRRWEKGSKILNSLWHYFPSYVINALILVGLHHRLMPKQEFKLIGRR